MIFWLSLAAGVAAALIFAGACWIFGRAVACLFCKVFKF